MARDRRMKYQFRKHYSREEARALLPQLRKWLERLDFLRGELQRFEQRIAAVTEQGNDAGGDTVNRWAHTMADMRDLLTEFEDRQILIKDLDRGLIDFPAIVGGREVFLCWEKDEDDIEFWHELDTGYAGRERL
jgi:hypothetical protein